MKRKYAILISLLIMSSVLTLTFLFKGKVEENIIVDFDFQFKLTDINDRIISKDLITDRPLIVAFFNTQCDLCVNEIPTIDDNIKKITESYDLIIISFEPEKSLKQFFTRYSLLEYDNVYIVSDKDEKLLQYFNISTYPSFLLFKSTGEQIYEGGALSKEVITKLLNIGL